MLRSRLKNIINKSLALNIVKEPYDLFVESLPSELDYYKDGGKYRLKAAWEAYGKPKDYKEALWQGLVETIGGSFKMPSIGYNEETDEYEYLNTGKDNDIVNRDIRAWDNDVIPFIKELKLGGYIREFDEEKNCWKYQKGGSVKKSRTAKEIFDYAIKLNPRFIQRLSEEPKALDFIDDEGNLSRGSHYLEWSTDDNGNAIVYARILEDDTGNLKLYNSKEAYQKALLNNDFLIMSPEEADLFTKHYKEFVPSYMTKWEEKFGSYKQGGQMNVIPEGALHARKNNMELAKEGGVTHKGIPVVDNEGNQQAEVEREEWTMTKELTEDVENWYHKFYNEDTTQKEKDEIAIKCGKRICKELLHNTEDRAGLIEKLLENE